MKEHLLIFWQRKLEDAYRENYDLQAENARLKALTVEMDKTINASQAECRRLKAEVERLTKAGDAMQDDLLFVVWPWNQKRFPSINAWNAAKEGKQS